jgi:hypothetical protein
MADSSLVFADCLRKELGTRFQKITRPGIGKTYRGKGSRSTVSEFALVYRRSGCDTVYTNAEYTTANPTLTATTPMINATITPHPPSGFMRPIYSCSMKGP